MRIRDTLEMEVFEVLPSLSTYNRGAIASFGTSLLLLYHHLLENHFPPTKFLITVKSLNKFSCWSIISSFHAFYCKSYKGSPYEAKSGARIAFLRSMDLVPA